ncbi:MAG: response regulator [Candidatus Rokuibacteriota bacterium]
MKRNPRYLTTGHVAKACEVSLVTVKKWIRLGKLRAFRTPGHHYRVTLEEFQRFRIEYGFPAEPEAPPGILVVDDEPEMVALVSDALRGMRPAPKLEAAFDGYEGMLKVGTFRPHLLVLDLRMPGLDGFEVCRRIKADPATQGTKILAITAYHEDAAKERALECGAEAFLPKPFTLKELKAQVKRLMARARG